jgi:hypothetical protein
VQLSINETQPAPFHHEIGKRIGPRGMRSPMAVARQVYGLVGSWVGNFGSWPVGHLGGHSRPTCFSTESMLQAFHSSEIFPALKRNRVIPETLTGLPVAGSPIPG